MGLVAKVMKKKGDSKKNISYHYVGLEVPQLLSVLSTQCEDVEMVEDLAAVWDTVEENIESEAFATGAVRLMRKVGEENV